MQDIKSFPLVSVIITSYNRGAYISEAIDSALAQDYPNFEVVISDNDSTDNTGEVIKKYLDDPRVKFYKNDTNIGMIPNFKKATEQLAKGEYITYISSDDYLINNSLLSEAVRLMQGKENVAVVFAENQTFNVAAGTFIQDKPGSFYAQNYKNGLDVFLDITKTGCFGWGASVYNKKLFMEFDVYSYKINSIDLLINTLLLFKGEVAFINKPSYVWRAHGNHASYRLTAMDAIANFGYLLKPYEYAKTNKIFSDKILDDWRDDVLFEQVKFLSLRFLPVNKKEYNIFMNYFKVNYPAVYKRVKKSAKWNILSLFFNNPAFSLRFFKVFSISHYHYLNQILAAGKYIPSSEK
jgi:glycosyltransferase involved in cell wall biosynthesis